MVRDRRGCLIAVAASLAVWAILIYVVIELLK